jgi:UDP:flavonoid glycosyltransferase YjiC (YdhE family)
MRLAAIHALGGVTGHRDERLRLRFDDAAGLLDRAQPWIEEHDDVLPPHGPAPAIETIPRLTVVILVVGSRGDVQPFIPIGLGLAKRHRVRLATHAEFRPLVEKAGLEFFPLAGDPHELMDYMVRTGGRLVPIRIDQLIEDVPRKRTVVGEILASTWRACTEPDPGHPDAPPFEADLIVANPPSYGHIHCAEALDVPLHMIFTMPWTPTRMFPHPMTHLDPGGHHPVRNYLSYSVANTLMWAGVADLVNEFRQDTLGLRPLELAQGTSLLDDAEVPMTYLFPESLVPRPPDWGPYVDLTNFVFWDQAAAYTPPDDLRAFLDAGDPPVYVGFGSVVVDDPEALSRTIFAAIAAAGVRAVVSRGWAEIGGDAPPGVHFVSDVPHDWLFPRCRAVCHHGGAGTTAAGLRAGLPTVVVPFFGDQFFWGQVISDAGAGRTIPADDLTAEALAEALTVVLGDDVRARAAVLSDAVRAEDGVAMVVDVVHARLPLPAMRCAHDVTHLATIWCHVCGKPVCESCRAREHGGHATHPYRWVDWSIREPKSLIGKLRDLMHDAATALRASDEELRPRSAPHTDGVVLGDVDRGGDTGGPVHRRVRPRPSRKEILA